MTDPRFTKPWHGVPRETLDWHPTVNADACIGCGTCVTGCGRMVYRYDFERRKSVVVEPLHCLVGCTTCANTCPTHAITFPSLGAVFQLESRPEVRHAIEDELVGRHDELAWASSVPHADRIIRLVVAAVARAGADTMILTLRPATPADALCQFMPGQYLELLPARAAWLARAYSIGNAPREDGSVELQVRRVAGGRMSEVLFQQVQVGDVLQARGPVGHFTMRSKPETPLLFVAGGTGFAPMKAMIEQELTRVTTRDIVLFWGVASSSDLYEVDLLGQWAAKDCNFRGVLAVEHGMLPTELPAGLSVTAGRLPEALGAAGTEAIVLSGRDAYVAGPPTMVPAVHRALWRLGIDPEHTFVDSFGV
jgi:CDP-4-dehydro-6-deoxyglucose reductase